MTRTALVVERSGCTARLFAGTSERMPEVSDNEVTLTVTSPPYWQAIDYDRHARDPKRFYRTRAYKNGFDGYLSYLEWMTSIFSEVRRVTRPGGYLAVVVGTVLYEGHHYPVPFDLTSRLVGDGWLFHQDIIWHKTTAGVKRAGVFIQKPYPGYYYPNIMTEYILLFRKPGEPIYKQISSAEQRERGRCKVGEVFVKEIANNIWHVAPVPPQVLDHPCPFPEEIPWRLVQMFSYPGDTVLDPFLGSGQTTKVAFALERSVVGYDIVPTYVRYAARRLDEPLSVRSNQLVAEFSKVHLDAPLGTTHRTRTPASTRHGSGTPSQLVLMAKE
jgi:site-specific DNA-methyltransferase (adenine-specific)